MPLFDRVAAVEIHPVETVALPFRLEGLRITFDVRKDRDTKIANTAEVEVYNLSDATRARIRELDDLLILSAGYEGETGPEVVFVGNIVGVSHELQPPDVVTKIQANDGERAMRKTRASFSYGPDASVAQVMQDVLEQFGLALKAFGASIPAAKFKEQFLARFRDQKFLQGFAFEGKAVDVVEKLARRLDLRVTVQNNELKVVPLNGDDGNRAALISPDSGLIGSPERLSLVDELVDPKKKLPGWRVRSLLQPKVEPGGVVALRCREVPTETQFRVERVQHQGDTHGETWETTVEVLERTAA